MPCFSLLNGLETQPWLGLCTLFISFQARLCELIHGGWVKEAGTPAHIQKTMLAAPFLGVAMGTQRWGDEARGLVLRRGGSD